MWRYVLAGAFVLWIARCEQTKSARLVVRNPRRRRNPNGLNATDKRALAEAERIAGEFHGEKGYRQVIELSERERQLPRFLVGLGTMPAIEYEPDRGSSRKDYVWRHESGDLGLGRETPGKPVLAVDPTTLRPVIVPMRSSMKLNSQRGLVG